MELFIFTDHAHFDIGTVHLSLESFLQCHQCSMNSIFNFHVYLVSLFQKYFSVLCVFANCSCLPVVVSSWWIDLGKVRASFVISCNQDWNSKWSVSSCLRFFLKEFGSLSAERGDSNRFEVFYKVVLNKLPGLLC